MSYTFIKYNSPSDLNENYNDDDICVKTNDSLTYFFNADRYVVDHESLEGYGIEITDKPFNYEDFLDLEESDLFRTNFNEISNIGIWKNPRDAPNLSRYSLYIELLGTSSFNIEYRFKQPYSFRFGFGGGEIDKGNSEILRYQWALITANRLFGKYNQIFELGAGLALGWAKVDVYESGILDHPREILFTVTYPPPYVLLSAGYRYQRIEGGILFRLGLSLIAYSKGKISSIWLPAISLGYTF